MSTNTASDRCSSASLLAGLGFSRASVAQDEPAGDRRPFINYTGIFGSAYSAVGRVRYLRVEQGF